MVDSMMSKILILFFAERIVVAPARWKPEFKNGRYRRLPLTAC